MRRLTPNFQYTITIADSFVGIYVQNTDSCCERLTFYHGQLLLENDFRIGSLLIIIFRLNFLKLFNKIMLFGKIILLYMDANLHFLGSILNGQKFWETCF